MKGPSKRFGETHPANAAMVALGVLVSLALAGGVAATYDDFHYPQEEMSERASAIPTLPTVSRHAAAEALFSCPGTGGTTHAGAGQNVTCEHLTWQIHAIWSNGDAVHVAAEAQFERWGLLAFFSSSKDSAPIFLRKSLGSLTGISQPWFNFSSTYLQQASTALVDLPSQLATNSTSDGEPDYPSMAATLAPQRDTAAISHAADVVKFAVAYSGRVKCGSTGVLKEDSTTGGIAELQDLRAPLPDNQKVIFDPPNYLEFWPSTFDNSKAGLVGGHLGVANVGAFSAGAGGFELLAFGPVPPHETGGVPPPFPYVPPPPTPPQPWQCVTFSSSTQAWIKHCGGTDKCQQQGCTRIANHTWTHGANTNYQGCGTCYCCEPSTAPTTLPRLPNINYNPGAFVALRDESAGGGTVNGTRYFYATNQSTQELPKASGAATFYQALLAVYKKDAGLVGAASPGMQVQLPEGDRRQLDMAHAALLATMNNYVGNQPNYGFGATYWSYGESVASSFCVCLYACTRV